MLNTHTVISIVTGSVNRLPSLQRVVASVRDTMPYGVPYEIIIVAVEDDADTLAWCAAQPDIRTVVQPALLGAIRAFDAGALAATGDYVVLANDDITFMQYALAKGLRYLETDPACGAVAFADNRPGIGKADDGSGYGVDTLTAQPHNVIYAQVGMVRRWLGNLVGWWGSLDPIMRQGHTYGGDNYLSARLWEFGYTVEAVRGVRIHDHIERDHLRNHNFKAEEGKPSAFYQRYPKGPVLADAPLIPPRDTERLRVLYLPVYEPGAHYRNQRAQKRGLRDAFARIGLVWEVDYVNQAFDLPALVDAWRPDVLFLQIHSTVEIDAADIAAARKVKPDMFIVNWNGDVYARHLTEPGMIDALRQCDLQTCVNASVLPRYEAEGIPAAYWQCGWEPVPGDLPAMPAHDVLLLGNCYSDKRKALGHVLFNLQGVDLGVYGSGWKRPTGNTTYDFATSAALIQNAKIVIGDNQFPDDYGFVSNRVFDTLANGGFLLHQRVPGMEELTGLKAGVHYVEWETLDELPALIAHWLNPKQKRVRSRIANAGQREALERHSFDARLRQLFTEIIPKVAARERNTDVIHI